MSEPDDLLEDLDALIEEDDLSQAQREVGKLRRQLRDLKRRASRLEVQVDRAEEIRDLALGVSQHDPAEPFAAPPADGPRPKVVSSLCCSDWHVNEVVTLESTNGENEYNPAIAMKRAERLFQGFAWYTDLLATKQDLVGIWVPLIGDILDTEIHVDGSRLNELSPMEAVGHALDCYAPGIRMLAKAFPKVPITIHTQRGNHGRIDRRVPASKVNEYSVEFVLYQWLARELRGVAEVHVGKAGTTYARILGHTVRLHHGDAFGYQGGVGGIQVPAKRWHLRAQRTREAAFSLIGHWHTYDPSSDVLINGSLKGPDAYSNFRELGNEAPRQAAFAIDAQRGRVFDRPIYVGEHGLARTREAIAA